MSDGTLAPDIAALVERRQALVDRLRTVLITSLDLALESDEVDEDEPLFGIGLGLDSIDALQLVLGVEAAFDVTLPPDDLTIYRSINTLADHLIAAEARPVA
ncbi:MAG: acyl carrier protein [Candidatus Rokuibacteriota bacterium]